MNTWELQQKIHDCIKENLHVGMTEKEIGEVISGVCPDWRGDLISGERTADIDGEPTERIIKKGDIVLFDLQIYSDGMWSDLTRVYFVGEPSEKQKTAYEAVMKAVSEGEKLLRPGTKGKDIWNTMHKAIGDEFAFAHHGGHRIGKDNFYLAPSFLPDSEEELKCGEIITLEPAVYYPGEFGIRLENNYIITENRYQRLCSLPMEISHYMVKG